MPRHSILGKMLLLAGLTLAEACQAPAAGREDQLAPLQRAEVLTQQKKWSAAAAAWQQVVDGNPYLGRAWRELGTALYQGKDYQRALPAFAKALQLGSGYPFRAAYNMARCHAQLAEKQQALEWLQKAFDLGFRDLKEVQEDKDLQLLHSDARFKKLAAIVDVRRFSRDEGWRFDLELLARELKRTHYAPYRKVSREEFDAQVNQLRQEIPNLSDNAIMVRFRKLIRHMGDGHTTLYGPSDDPKDRAPVQFYLFAEGLYIVDADPRVGALAGARVLRVGGQAVEQVVRELDPVVARDNDMGFRGQVPEFLRSPKVLNGLGLIPDDKSLPLTIRDAKGIERDVVLPADSGEPQPQWVSARQDAGTTEPLYLKKRAQAYWFEYLPDQKLVYFQFNVVHNEGQESIEQFCTRLFRFIEENEVRRLVIDLRWNDGGDNFLNEPVIHGLIRCDKINQVGKLFVIVGRNTFSAAMCAAALIQRHANPIFVGEPTGSSPNHIGESAVVVNLPYSRLRATVADLYWQNSVAMDYRTWIAPTIYAPPTFALFRANRDPAMEAILPHKDEKDAHK